ncbi:DUF948 domain-containing protein [Pontibacillus litoralis]|uniref:General stress protein n=1 Tax=Pontibacillus litoralis JSM 072002 TaxID=1385512 RepID=A0A0A5HU93_9BACI|nr:DUF948 domain-containing protein [Pontibacillus litoralis]KGX87217.1 general stress protein [Pontibacillus litoralis JSM 072002]
MTLLGIGVLIIGIAFFILVIYLSKTLNQLANVLDGVHKTVDQLPEQLDSVMKETGQLLNKSNDTLEDVNTKLAALSPLFYIVGDIGESSRKLSSSLVHVTESMKQSTKEGKDVANNHNLNGLYGAIALGYYIMQKRNILKKSADEAAEAFHENA